MLSLIKFIILAGVMWFMAALWIDSGGDSKYIWMTLIPVIYLLCLNMLKD